MSLDETIAALADPTRRELLRRLARKPRRAGELARRASCEPRVGLFNTLLRFFSVAKVSEGARVASPLREIRLISPNRSVSQPLRCHQDCGNPRTRTNFAGFSGECRRSQTVWRSELDSNSQATS
jgi:DNA-binding transcriptional ArsR family regulator